MGVGKEGEGGERWGVRGCFLNLDIRTGMGRGFVLVLAFQGGGLEGLHDLLGIARVDTLRRSWGDYNREFAVLVQTCENRLKTGRSDLCRVGDIGV